MGGWNDVKDQMTLDKDEVVFQRGDTIRYVNNTNNIIYISSTI